MDDCNRDARNGEVAAYQPPKVTYLGNLTELTRQAKEVGAADGTVFDGIDLGS